jgi:DNA repair protein RadC
MKLPEIRVKYSYKQKFKDRTKISTSHDAYKIFESVWDKDTLEYSESSYALFLNYSNQLLGFYKVSTGGTNGTIIDPKIILGVALKVNASNLILAHNHPSGSLAFSKQDLAQTKTFISICKQLDILLWDHLVITKEGYISMSDEGEILSI